MRRLVSPENRLLTIVLALVMATAFVVSGLALFAQTRSQRATTREICVAVNNLNRAISMTLERSKGNLSHVAYFRTHPRELRAQEREIDHTLRAFRPRDCH